MTVATRAGRGTEFVVGVPVSAQRRVEVAAPAPPAEWRGNGRVLVVGDEGDVRECVEQAFVLRGLDVLAVNDAPQAVELFRRHTDEIACVMCDVAMPAMPGEELVAAIRTIRPGVQVALMTGFADAEVRGRLPDGDPIRVLHKPFSLEVLRAAARELTAGARPS